MSNKLLTLTFNCSRFRGIDRLVLLAIADRINEETWTCVCTYEDLMRRCHCARSVLAEALVELHKSGVLVKRRRFSAATVYSLDEHLLREWQYPKPNGSESKPPRSFGNRTNTDSGEREYGSPNAYPVEPNSPPSGAGDRGAGTESLRFGFPERSEEGVSSTAIANAIEESPATQETENLGGDPRTPQIYPEEFADPPVSGQGTASPRDPALTGDHRRRTHVPPKLWMFLMGRPEVEVRFDWGKWWTRDFEQALKLGYSFDEVWLATFRSGEVCT